jgi:RNA polymerase sigma-70 factor (ECF subfamily)
MKSTSAEPFDENDLITRVQNGEGAAFSPLLDHYLGEIRAFLALRSPAWHLVDELAHEAFVFAYFHIQDFEVGTSFRAWLRAIAQNLLRARIQQFSREQVNQDRYGEHLLVHQAGERLKGQQRLELEHLEFCLRRAPEAMREILRLKYGLECTTEEMAAKLGRSLVWVRTTLFRLRQDLKRCIANRLAEAALEGGEA